MTDTAAAEPTGDAAAVVPDPAAAPNAAADAGQPDGAAPPVPKAEPAVPETYTLALPDTSPLDPKVVEQVTAFAKANRLTNEAAQAVLAQMDAGVGETLKVLEAANKPGGTLYEARVKEWGQSALAAYDLGNGSPDRLKAVLVEAQAELAKAPPAIKEFLETSGYGSHPDAIRWLRDLHARTKEKPAVLGDKGAPPPKQRTMAERFYETTEPAGSAT